MEKYTKEDLALLFLFKEKGSTTTNPLAGVILNTELYKMLGMSKEKVVNAIEIADKNGFISGNQRFIFPTQKCELVIYWNQKFEGEKNMTIQEKKIIRYKVLNKLYEETGGSKRALVNAVEMGESLGIDPGNMRETVDYLSAEGLVERVTLAGFIAITHLGVVQIENANEHPDVQTDYFPPVNIIHNHVNIGGSNSAPIQIGNTNSTQTTNITNNNLDELRSWVSQLEKIIVEQGLKNQELTDEIETVKSLLSTKNPKVTFINSSIEVIKNILLGIASNAAFQGLLAALPK